MRIWYQLLSSEIRLSNFLAAAQQLCTCVAAPGTTVEVRGTRHGALGDQYRIFWHYDVREVVDNGLKVRASKAYDAFVIANSLDPALVELREMLDIPVLSFMEVNCFTACTMGERFGVVVPNEKMVPRYTEIVRGYGLASRLAAVEPLRWENMTRFDDVFTDPAVADEIHAQVLEASHRAIAKGAEVLILTGPQSAFMAQRGARLIDGVPLLDSYSLLVKQAEAMVAMHRLTGIAVSRRLLYQAPPTDLVRQAAEVREIDALRDG
jgi:Asp/Glu/hydantoin racemase